MLRYSPALRRLDWLVAQPIAHRGLHDAARGIIENTQSAFAAAIAHGLAIECDLQITGDGEAIVFHDDKVDRLTDGKGFVRDHTVAALKRSSFRASRDRIQTLGELLDQTSGKVPLVVELKSRWDGSDALTARALEVLKTYRGPYGLMSFDPDLLAAVRARSPGTARGIVGDRATDGFYRFLPLGRRLELRYLTHLLHTQPDFVSFRWRDLPFEPVCAFRAAGGPVITWTVRSAEQAVRARRYCDQITFEGFLPA